MIQILILSVHKLLVFSDKLLISIKSMEIHKGKNEVKYRQIDTNLDIYFSSYSHFFAPDTSIGLLSNGSIIPLSHNSLTSLSAAPC